MMLRDRLPRLDERALELANALYGPQSVSPFPAWDRTLKWRWRHRGPMKPTEIVTLAAGPGAAHIAIERDRGFCPDPALDWHSRTGEARLLAWTLSYEPLIAQLRKVFGVPFEPVAIRAARSESFALGFEVRDERGEELLAGAIDVNAELVSVSEDAGRNSEDAHASEAIPIAFRVIIGSIKLSVADLRSLASEDAIVLGSAARLRDGSRVRLESQHGGVAIAVRLGPAGMRVESIETSYVRNGRSTMQTQGEPPPIDVDSLAVQMSFDAGEITMTVRDLRSLARGSVIPTGRNLADSPVTIRVNGVAFATGELVLIDEVLAVRIIELQSRGFD